jgi:hypothetical protein
LHTRSLLPVLAVLYRSHGLTHSRGPGCRQATRDRDIISTHIRRPFLLGTNTSLLPVASLHTLLPSSMFSLYPLRKISLFVIRQVPEPPHNIRYVSLSVCRCQATSAGEERGENDKTKRRGYCHQCLILRNTWGCPVHGLTEVRACRQLPI